jgi:hypothetical protein
MRRIKKGERGRKGEAGNEEGNIKIYEREKYRAFNIQKTVKLPMTSS